MSVSYAIGLSPFIFTPFCAPAHAVEQNDSVKSKAKNILRIIIFAMDANFIDATANENFL